MCALGVAARLQKDIEVDQKDALTGEMIHVVTLSGSVASLEPKTAVAWAGMKKGPDGKMVSAGCFKQAFFVNADNLKKWVEQHPTATGKADHDQPGACGEDEAVARADHQGLQNRRMRAQVNLENRI